MENRKVGLHFGIRRREFKTPFKNHCSRFLSRARASPVFTTKRIKEIFHHFHKASNPFFSNINSMIEQGKQDQIDIKELLKGSKCLMR